MEEDEMTTWGRFYLSYLEISLGEEGIDIRATDPDYEDGASVNVELSLEKAIKFRNDLSAMIERIEKEYINLEIAKETLQTKEKEK